MTRRLLDERLARLVESQKLLASNRGEACAIARAIGVSEVTLSARRHGKRTPSAAIAGASLHPSASAGKFSRSRVLS
jgi:transcriptional regulator with XRE-family HTH domain